MLTRTLLCAVTVLTFLLSSCTGPADTSTWKGRVGGEEVRAQIGQTVVVFPKGVAPEGTGATVSIKPGGVAPSATAQAMSDVVEVQLDGGWVAS